MEDSSFDSVADAASSNRHEDFIKIENLTEDQTMSDDCPPGSASISDVCQYSNVNYVLSSAEAYLLHKIKWKTSSNTESDVPSGPIVKAENLFETSGDNTCTCEWDKRVKHKVISGNNTPCHVTTENDEEVVYSCYNVPSDCVTHENCFRLKTGNSRCTAFVEDILLKHENPSLGTDFEDVKTEHATCTTTLEDVKTEISTDALEPVLQPLGNNIYGKEERMQTHSEESQHNICTRPDLVTDTFPCTKHNLTCTTEMSLDHHLYRFHNDEYGVSSRTREGEDLPAVVDILNSCNEDMTEDGKKSGQVDEKPYKCTSCGKGFGRNKTLRQHMKNHSVEKSYTCTVCGKEFVWNSQLECHMKIHSSEKTHTCSICGKGFDWKSHLETHMRVHSGEKPYKCTVCGKGFGQRGYIKAHEKIHSGDKLYTCSVCGKGFHWNCQLITHMRLHSGEKPYKCTVCGRGFSQNGAMNAHMMRIHSVEKPQTCPYIRTLGPV